MLSLVPGANLVVWPFGRTPPAAAARFLTRPYRAINGLDPATGAWLRYFPNGPSYLNNLDMLATGAAFWIIAD